MEIDIDKGSSFTLEMKIDGDVSSSDPPIMRFVIHCTDMALSFIADRVDNGVYEINIPKLAGIVDPGEYESDVEVIVDGKYFIPLKDKIRLRKDLQPVVKISDSGKPSHELSVSNITIKKPVIKKTDEIIRRQK